MTWVHDRIFAAGGEYIPGTWAGFRDQTRVSSILHLNPGAPMAFAGPAPESLLWMDVDREAQVDLADRWLAGRFLVQQIRAGRSVLLHSGVGRHRTRWAFTAFLLVQGVSLRTALRRVESAPWMAPYDTYYSTWQTFAGWLEQEAPRALESGA